MDDLEKVETIRTKCNVSYTDAKAALDAADGNVLDAIIWLESQGKTQTTSAHAAAAERGGRVSVTCCADINGETACSTNL